MKLKAKVKFVRLYGEIEIESEKVFVFTVKLKVKLKVEVNVNVQVQSLEFTLSRIACYAISCGTDWMLSLGASASL